MAPAAWLFDALDRMRSPPSNERGHVKAADLGWLSREPQAQAEWIDFLTRVREHVDPVLSPVAEGGYRGFLMDYRSRINGDAV